MDQYFVLAPDGSEDSAVGLPGLLQWLREGRVLEATLIRKNGAGPVPAARGRSLKPISRTWRLTR